MITGVAVEIVPAIIKFANETFFDSGLIAAFRKAFHHWDELVTLTGGAIVAIALLFEFQLGSSAQDKSLNALREAQRVQAAIIDQLKRRDFSKEQYEGFKNALSGAVKAPRVLTIFTSETDEASDFSGAVKDALTNADVNWVSMAFNPPGIPVAALSPNLPNTGLQWYVSPTDPDKEKLLLIFSKACAFVPGFDCSWNTVRVANIPSPALFVLPRVGAFSPRHAWEFKDSIKAPWETK